MYHRAILLRGVAIMLLLATIARLGVGAADAADVLTQHYDNARTGANLAETTLGEMRCARACSASAGRSTPMGRLSPSRFMSAGLAIDTAS